MTERSPWWRAFLPKKKNGGKDPTLEADFDPFAQRSGKQKDPNKASGDQPQQDSDKGSGLSQDETFDDSRMDSVFNEQTCRRNLTVSRSGRFKEKRRIRSSLPSQERETEHGTTGI
ncbi:proline-rich protein 15-like protein [Notolabrus celidotus]|uniref:proline-rich protein 15-like protein n=1 Tax=Notolabrus celidotus TaxID=1203425 RepID=UPI00148FBE30|nr:proline-rich protein 15-like protein [Notolabrus celidotus]